MIKKLHIKNFKSIKDLEIDCARVNVFIGEPNTGKSNILEAVGIFSIGHEETPIKSYNSIKKFIRARNTIDLFYEKNIEDEISILAWYPYLGSDIFTMKYVDREFVGTCTNDKTNRTLIEIHLDNRLRNNQVPKYFYPPAIPIRYYVFKSQNRFKNESLDYLNPPYGDNLLKLIETHVSLDEIANSFFLKFGFNLSLKTYLSRNLIEVTRVKTGRSSFDLPYSLTSDTLQRIVFYLAAIMTSKDASIILEEPEAHTFPYYTQFLSEKIAKDTGNQFFLSTHNPYFLKTLMEKTPKDDLSIFVTFYQDYQTKIYKLTNQEISEYMESGESLFIQIKDLTDQLVEGKKN